MRERLKRAVLKTAIPERVSGVQIPLPPPDIRWVPSTMLGISAHGSDAAQAPQLENLHTRKGIGGQILLPQPGYLIPQSVRRARAAHALEKQHQPIRDNNSPTLGLSAPPKRQV